MPLPCTHFILLVLEVNVASFIGMVTRHGDLLSPEHSDAHLHTECVAIRIELYPVDIHPILV